MEKIPLPDAINIHSENGNETVFEIAPYYSGYGPTMGNALRRVLLSSLPGAAVTTVRIEGVEHEFSTIKGVKEDVVSVLLNLKQLRVRMTGEEDVELTMKAKGEKELKAKDFEKNAAIEIVDPEMPIATLTDPKAELEMYVTVKKGRGYLPVEQRESEERALGEIAVDAVFTPVERVSFRVENVRVGKETEFNKLILTLRTDGTIAPKEALSQAASILEDHFRTVAGDLKDRLTYRREIPVAEEAEMRAKKAAAEIEATKESMEAAAILMEAPAEEAGEEKPAKNMPIEQFPVQTRVQNVLEKEGIRTVAGLVQKTREQLLDLDGLGEKAVDEIEDALAKMDLKLRETKE